jgi:hypothetical protein
MDGAAESRGENRPLEVLPTRCPTETAQALPECSEINVKDH